eukprot:269794_1
MPSLLIVVLHALWMQNGFAEDCIYAQVIPYMDSNNTYQCGYACFDDAVTGGQPVYVDVTAASFDDLKAACPSIQHAIEHYGSDSCSSLSALVWMDGYCSCPFCPCEQDPQIIDYHEEQSLFKKQCTKCSCVTINTGDTVWQCEPDIYEVSNAYEWNHFTCSAHITCSAMDPNNQYIYHPGESWFEGVDYDPRCQTFCYCQYDGTTYCETSYADIVSSSHEALRTAYFDESNCHDSKGCITQPNLLVRRSTSYCICPKCTCHSVEELSYAEYTEHHSESNVLGFFDTPHIRHCLECECVLQDGDDTAERVCDQSKFAEYVAGADTCPPTATGTCVSGWGNSSSRADVDLSYETCYGDEIYCGWTRTVMTDSHNNPIVTGGSSPYLWQCEQSTFCEAFEVADGDCYELVLDVGAMYRGCPQSDDPNAQLMMRFYSDARIHMHQMCCSGDNCNDEDVDTRACSYNTQMNEMFNAYVQCQYGEESPHHTWFCEHEDTISCHDLEEIGTWWFGCDCSAFSSLYSRSGSAGKNALTYQLADKMTQLDEWITLFECALHFTCDLSRGMLSINGVAVRTPSPTEPDILTTKLEIKASESRSDDSDSSESVSYSESSDSASPESVSYSESSDSASSESSSESNEKSQANARGVDGENKMIEADEESTKNVNLMVIGVTCLCVAMGLVIGGCCCLYGKKNKSRRLGQSERVALSDNDDDEGGEEEETECTVMLHHTKQHI